MRSARRVLSLVGGLAAGAWAAWPEPLPAPEVVPAPERVEAAPAEPPSAAPPTGNPIPRTEAVDPRQRIEALEAAILEVTGEPAPFPPEVGAAFREAGIRTDLGLAAAEVGFELEQLDCAEYPCILVARPHDGVKEHEVHRALRERGYRIPLSPPLLGRTIAALGDPAVPPAKTRTRYRLAEAATR